MTKVDHRAQAYSHIDLVIISKDSEVVKKLVLPVCFTDYFMLRVDVGGKMKQYGGAGPMELKHVVVGG